MSNEESTLLKAINEAAASIWLDDLPLSPDYVLHYTEEKLQELKMESPVLVLQRGVNDDRR